jgi:dihydroflavonol-4-reductase
MPNLAVRALGKFGDIMEALGKKGPINTENAWTSTLFHWFDHSKATRELGFKPRPASEALRESVEWMQQNGLLK